MSKKKAYKLSDVLDGQIPLFGKESKPEPDEIDWTAKLHGPIHERSHGPTQSKEEALDLLRKYRRELITKGRAIARRICAEEGTVHSRRVFAEMESEINSKGVDVGNYWLGAIFGSTEFQWTGEWYNVPQHTPTNNHGGNGVRIWMLRDEQP